MFRFRFLPLIIMFSAFTSAQASLAPYRGAQSDSQIKFEQRNVKEKILIPATLNGKPLTCKGNFFMSMGKALNTHDIGQTYIETMGDGFSKEDAASSKNATSKIGKTIKDIVNTQGWSQAQY